MMRLVEHEEGRHLTVTEKAVIAVKARPLLAEEARHRQLSHLRQFEEKDVENKRSAPLAPHGANDKGKSCKAAFEEKDVENKDSTPSPSRYGDEGWRSSKLAAEAVGISERTVESLKRGSVGNAPLIELSPILVR